VIRSGRVVVQCDVQGGGFVAAFDIESGNELWRTPRADVPTWSTPAVFARDKGPDHVIVNGYRHIGAYELETGREVWRMSGGGDIPVPTPIAWRDRVFITNAHGSSAPIYAVLTGAASGDISLAKDATSGEHVAWSTRRGGNYMQTPIVWGGRLYCCSDRGVLAAYDARTGERLFRARVGKGRSGFTASPVIGGGKLYVTSEDGSVYVIEPGKEYEEIQKNELDEPCMATPAISDGVIYFRTRRHLVAIASVRDA